MGKHEISHKEFYSHHENVKALIHDYYYQRLEKRCLLPYKNKVSFKISICDILNDTLFNEIWIK